MSYTKEDIINVIEQLKRYDDNNRPNICILGIEKVLSQIKRLVPKGVHLKVIPKEYNTDGRYNSKIIVVDWDNMYGYPHMEFYE